MFYHRFQQLCQQRGVSVTRAAEEIGLSRTIGTKWKKTGAMPNGETLAKIEQYFGISVGELLSPGQEQAAHFSHKDERDMEKKLRTMLEQLETDQEGLLFDGEPLDDNTRELLLLSLKNSMELSKRIAKQKYTPHKYRG